MREHARPPGGAGTLAAAPQHTWSRTFPATPEHVGRARRFLAGLLGDSPAAGDAQVCLSEVVTNAIQRSRSARPAGQFTVRATVRRGRLRAEVEDEGGPWAPSGERDGQHGRGLLIVGCLAHDWGITGGGGANRVVWFECDQP
jgi:anti-sigma regulatory factor (Ser/Thr protein kinase)